MGRREVDVAGGEGIVRRTAVVLPGETVGRRKEEVGVLCDRERRRSSWEHANHGVAMTQLPLERRDQALGFSLAEIRSPPSNITPTLVKEQASDSCNATAVK
jgi:hypothetical protein